LPISGQRQLDFSSGGPPILQSPSIIDKENVMGKA
jgi:hypothetical protein